MTTLRDIRNRIASVKNIKQITKSMEMVAAARLHKAVPKAEHANLFAGKLKSMYENLLAAVQDISNPLFQIQKTPKELVVLIASDTGLTGPFNSTLFSTLDKFLKERDPDQLDLILFGRKAVDYYQRKAWPTIQKIENWGGKISFRQIKSFTNELTHAFLHQQYSAIWVAYTHYINTFSREVVIEKFLNIDKPTVDPHQPIPNYIFEPNPAELLGDLLPRYCLAKMKAMLDQSYASELSARVVSMQAATKNAEDMIENLTLFSNKVRQAGITKEMLEITSSAEAMK